MNEALPSLFDVLPENCFGPLAAPNRRHYWRLFMRLFDDYFGPEAPLPPSHGFPRREVTAAIERYLQTDDPWETDDGLTPDAPLAVRANGIYERYRQAGWLRQERIGAREMVTMPPVVGHLFNTLVEFIERGPSYLGAKVRAIELQLQQVQEGKAGGDMLDEAASQARHLLSHVAAIGVQVRDLMPELSKTESTAIFVRELFQRYVSELFIGDYADLHKADHPLARRAAIIGIARELEYGPRHEMLTDWYAEHLTHGDRERARQRLQRNLRRLHEIDRIDDYLGRLDDDLRQANRRALAFLDYRLRTPASLQRLLEQALHGVLVAPADVLVLPVPAGPLLGEDRLRAPRRRPRPIARSANVVTPLTPQQLARIALLQRMKRVRLVLPEDLQRYLEPFRAAGEVESARLPLQGIAELRAYQTLLTLALRSHRPGGLRKDEPLQRHLQGFTVTLRPDRRSQHAVLESPAFVVTFHARARRRA